MLLDCSFYNNERNSLIESLHTTSIGADNSTLFILIMESKCPNTITALGKYLSTGFHRRKIASEIIPAI